MPTFRKCSQCGKKVLEYTLCKCEQERYREYKRRRMKDKKENQRQKFYSDKSWIKLRDSMQRHYVGVCVVCWDKGLTQENEYVHHVETIKDRYDLRLDEDNLICVCDSCHKRIHVVYEKSLKDKIKLQKKLKDLVKKFNDEFY